MIAKKQNLAQYTHRNTADGKGGIPCPICKNLIPVTLNDILTKRAFTCPSQDCASVMRLDQRGSTDALTALKMIKSRMDEI